MNERKDDFQFPIIDPCTTNVELRKIEVYGQTYPIYHFCYFCYFYYLRSALLKVNDIWVVHIFIVFCHRHSYHHHLW